jgi:hypothetical protein
VRQPKRQFKALRALNEAPPFRAAYVNKITVEVPKKQAQNLVRYYLAQKANVIALAASSVAQVPIVLGLRK